MLDIFAKRKLSHALGSRLSARGSAASHEENDNFMPSSSTFNVQWLQQRAVTLTKKNIFRTYYHNASTMFSGSNDGTNQQPIIVQGTVVHDSKPAKIAYEEQATGSYIAPVQLVEGTGDDEYQGKGQIQEAKFRDVSFAIAFFAQLLIMLGIGVFYSGTSDDGEGGESADYDGLIYLVFICGIFATCLSWLCFSWMMRNASTLVKTALIFSLGASLTMAFIGLLYGNMLMSILNFIFFGIGCCYARYVWHRIPFAAANLTTALTAVKANGGLLVAALCSLILALVWSLWWSVAAGGALADSGEFTLFLTLVSYFWTHQVLQNTLVCITAGVIGTWWFAPSEANSYFSQGLKDSTIRATTYSFGSICFGSLLVAVIQALRQVQRHAQTQGDEGKIVACIIDCILGCIQGIIEYVNKWAYVYVGLYGYPYVEAGKNVLQLFRSKGWSAIITDDLVDNVLFMVSLGVGLITGFVALCLEAVDNSLLNGIGYGGDGFASFLIGFLVGLVFSNIIFSIIGSSVNATIVLFAESPSEFQHNHPELDQLMRQSWREAWPDQCRGL